MKGSRRPRRTASLASETPCASGDAVRHGVGPGPNVPAAGSSPRSAVAGGAPAEKLSAAALVRPATTTKVAKHSTTAARAGHMARSARRRRAFTRTRAHPGLQGLAGQGSQKALLGNTPPKQFSKFGIIS
jgi:hypothetical protein